MGDTTWPPKFSAAGVDTLGAALSKIENLPDYDLTCCVETVSAGRSKSSVAKYTCASIVQKVALKCEGLCLQCIVEDESDLTKRCTKHI